jgi:hypothetical protein
MARKKHGLRVGILWTIAVGAVTALFAYSSFSRPGVVALCVGGGVAFILVCAEHGWLWKASAILDKSLQPFGKLIRATIIIVFIGGVMTWIGVIVYPPIRRHTLSIEEDQRFERPLRDKKDETLTIQIGCPLNDEKTCVFATQFIPLFGESGWKVSPFIQRLTLSKSQDGVIVYRRGGNKDFMNRTSWLYIVPFSQLGLKWMELPTPT